MLDKLASLILKISANGAEAEKELRTLEKSIGRFADKAKKLGTTLSKTITAPLAALATASVVAANTQLQAEARLLTALKGREEIQKRLLASAAELQSRSTFGDEAIIEQQAFLAALGLNEAQINSTIEAAAQLSAALGMELNSAVRNLAKTYSGLAGELGESIPALRELTAEEMKAGGAIAYVNNNYKGFAETAATTGTGALVQLKNQLGDIAEKIGVALLPALNALLDKLKVFADWLGGLNPETVKWGVGLSGALAVTGPLALGATSVIKAWRPIVRRMPKLIAGMKTLKSGALAAVAPFGLIAAVFGTIAYKMYQATQRAKEFQKELDELKKKHVNERAEEMYNLQYTLYNRAGVTDEEIDRALSEMKAQLNKDAAYYTSASGGSLTERQRDELGVLRAGIRALEEIKQTRMGEADTLVVINEETDKAIGLIPKLQQRVTELNKALNLATTEDEIRRINGELSKTNEELRRLQNAQPFKGVATTVDTTGANLSALVAPPTLNTKGKTLDGSAIGWWKYALAEEVKAAEEAAAAAAERMRSIGVMLSNTIADLGVTLGESLGQFMAGEMVNPLQGILKVLGQALKQLGAALISYSTLVQAAKAALSSGGGIAGGIALGITAVAAGVALEKLADEPIKLAKGALAYAPTLAVVGDNKGASYDPEVIAPLSKLRQYIGEQKLELVGDVEFILRGNTAVALLTRENIRLSRLG